VETPKLRLYRLHPNKSRLAWETCCRFFPPISKAFWFILTDLAAMGSSILFSYPEIGTIAGVQGSITYAACSSLPLMIFPLLAPIIRRRLPDGFVLTMWVREHFGAVAGLYLSFLSWVSPKSKNFAIITKNSQASDDVFVHGC
jgi:hypothetical protein